MTPVWAVASHPKRKRALLMPIRVAVAHHYPFVPQGLPTAMRTTLDMNQVRRFVCL